MKTTKIFAFALLLAFLCTVACAAFPFGNIGLGVDEPLAQLDVDGTNILRGGRYFIMTKDDNGDIDDPAGGGQGARTQIERLNSISDIFDAGFFFYTGPANDNIAGFGREHIDSEGDLAILGAPVFICNDDIADVEIRKLEDGDYTRRWHIGSATDAWRADRVNATNSTMAISYFDYENRITIIEPPTDGAGFSGEGHTFTITIYPGSFDSVYNTSRQTIFIVGAHDMSLEYKFKVRVYCRLPDDQNPRYYEWFESEDMIGDDVVIELLLIPGEHARLQLLHIRDAYTGDPIGINVVSDDGYRFLLNGH